MHARLSGVPSSFFDVSITGKEHPPSTKPCNAKRTPYELIKAIKI
jgi:hypothetical protein